MSHVPNIPPQYIHLPPHRIPLAHNAAITEVHTGMPEKKETEFEPVKTPELPFVQRQALTSTITLEATFAIRLIQNFVQSTILPKLTSAVVKFSKEGDFSLVASVLQEIHELCMIPQEGSPQKVFSEDICVHIFALIETQLKAIQFPNSDFELRYGWPIKDFSFENAFSEVFFLFHESPSTQSLLSQLWGNHAVQIYEDSDVKTTLDKHPYAQRVFFLSKDETKLKDLTLALQYDTRVTMLEMGIRGHPSADDLQALTQMLESNRTVKSLYVKIECHEALTAVLRGLQYNASIIKFKLEQGKIKGEAGTAFADMIRYNRTLSELIFTNSKISEDTVENVAQAISINQNLNAFTLSRSRIIPGTIEALARAFMNNRSITYLDLSSSFPKETAASDLAALAQLLSQEKSKLQHMKLSNAYIESKDILILLKALSTNKSLNELNLSNNRLDDTFAQELADILPQNKTLQVLNLKDNRIPKEGIKLLLDSLSRGTSLKKLTLQASLIAYQNPIIKMHIDKIQKQNAGLEIEVV